VDLHFPLSVGPMCTHPGNCDHIDMGTATPALPPSPPGHPPQPCNEIGRMGDSESGELVLCEDGLCLLAPRHQRIQRCLSQRNLRRAMRTREQEAKSWYRAAALGHCTSLRGCCLQVLGRGAPLQAGHLLVQCVSEQRPAGTQLGRTKDAHPAPCSRKGRAFPGSRRRRQPSLPQALRPVLLASQQHATVCRGPPVSPVHCGWMHFCARGSPSLPDTPVIIVLPCASVPMPLW